MSINLIWTFFNLVLLGAVLGVAAETRQVRQAHRVIKSMPARLLINGQIIPVQTDDFSMGGLGVTLDNSQVLQRGMQLDIELAVENTQERCRFPVEVVMIRGQHVGLLLRDMTMEQQRNYVRCTFAAPSVWSDWGRDADVDKPLESFAEVFAFGATGYVRLLESLHSAWLSFWRNDMAVALRQRGE